MAPTSQWNDPSRSLNRDCRSQAPPDADSVNSARIATFAAVPILGDAHESDALPVSCTDATFENEKFVNVVDTVAEPNVDVAFPSLAQAPASVMSADEITPTRQGLATPPPN